MPSIANFSGAKLIMYYDDHYPPHVHIKYQGKEFKFDFNEGKFIGSSIGLIHSVRKDIEKFCELNKNILNKKWEELKL